MARKLRTAAAMMDLMHEDERHAWTLDELHDALRQRAGVIDFSSVYRAAEKLTAAGVTRKLVVEDGRTRFELVGAHHDHLYCTRCHKLVSIPCVVEEHRFAAVERATGAAILDHHTVLRGVCRDCREAGAEPGPGL